ncbi:MAG: hypothetical protein HIU57_03120 [Acidobacteria bacterium]|nr:hypothetical protein [Acidobacteriota bacterium]
MIPFLGCSAKIGSVVPVRHVAPDLRWWKRNECRMCKDQMEGTTMLRVAQGVGLLF